MTDLEAKEAAVIAAAVEWYEQQPPAVGGELLSDVFKRWAAVKDKLRAAVRDYLE